MITAIASDNPLRAQLDRLLDVLGRFPMPLTELMFRVGVGSVFFKSGLNKLDNWNLTVQLFANEYQVPLLPPEIAAYLGATAEIVCPILIVLGFGARLGAAGLLGMTAVIQIFVYPDNWSEHLLWAGLLVYILTRGAGMISLDHLIARHVLGRAA